MRRNLSGRGSTDLQRIEIGFVDRNREQTLAAIEMVHIIVGRRRIGHSGAEPLVCAGQINPASGELGSA